jgi:hypothetical protein
LIPILSLRARGYLVIVTVILVLVAACGSDEPTAPMERVVDLEQIFTADDLRAAGMKTSKQYDVTDLPGGVDAWYGFIQTDSGPLDVEARFYNSHADAVSLGTALADEASGEDALIEEDDATWAEGIKDRQRMRSGGTADLAAWSGQRGPNYADFVIYGNMILLCQGDQPAESIETCYELIEAIEANSASTAD